MFCHIDADAFFASVLQRRDPRLKGKPLLALGMGGGCVIAASYEAKAFDVKTGMRLTDALKLCPQALRLPSDFAETGLASRQIEEILGDYSPFLEQMSIDEWFLDLRDCVGGIPADVERWAKSVQTRIAHETDITVSIGIAPSKLLAKMASEYRKPGGVTILFSSPSLPKGGGTGEGLYQGLPLPNPPPRFAKGREECIEPFLHARPAAAIPGIGRARVPHCDSEGWKSAWDIANADPRRLKALFGRPGLDMQRELKGEALAQLVREGAPPKSVSRARSFRPERREEILWAHLLEHLSYTVLKMRRKHLACQYLSVWVRDGEYHYHHHDLRLPRPMATEESIRPYVRETWGQVRFSAEKRTCPLSATQIGLALTGLTAHTAEQSSLFKDPHALKKEESLQRALDNLHEKLGRRSVVPGSSL